MVVRATMTGNLPGAGALAVTVASLLQSSVFDASLAVLAVTEVGRWSTIAAAVTAINVVLLIGLLSVWMRNFRTFRSKHTLGLAVFGVLLLLRNAWALYIYQFHDVLAAWFASEAVPGIAWQAVLLLHVLETVALAFLAWVTWD